MFQREGRNSEKPRGGFPLKEKAFLLPLSGTLLLPPSLSLFRPLNTQSRQRSERSEARGSTGSLASCSSLCYKLKTCEKCTKNGNNFGYFSIKTTHCHVDILQQTSVVDALNMARLSARSQGRLSGEDYQEQALNRLSAV